MRKKQKVRYFHPILNWILSHLNIILAILCCLLFTALYSVTKNLIIKLDNAYNYQLSQFEQAVIGVVLSLVPSVIVTIVTLLFNNKSTTHITIKRVIYAKTAHQSRNETKRWMSRWLSSIVHVFYHHPRKNILEQQNITTDLLKTINSIPNEDAPKIFWIEGEAYSGKTTAILNFFIDLISSRDYKNLFAKLDGKILYFDAGRDNFNLRQIYSSYCTNKYEQDLLIFDNLHKLSGGELLEMLKKLAENVRAFAIVFCIRRPEEFISENDKVRLLKSAVSSTGKQYTLSLIDHNKHELYQSRDFARFFQEFNKDEANFFKDYDQYFIIHLASLYTRKDIDVAAIDKVKSYLSGMLCDKDKDYIKVLITLICASLFTGSFSKKLIHIANPELSNSFIRTTLIDLAIIGLIGRFPNRDDEYYCFNEKIAHFYFERGFQNESLQKIFMHNLSVLSGYYERQLNTNLVFLYSLIIDEHHDQHILFNKLAVNVNFVNLYEEMIFLLKFSKSKEEQYSRELGILCDRKGDIKKAKEYYLKDLQSSKQADSLYRLVQMDHGMYFKYAALVRESLASDNAFIKTLALYWRVHIEMHKGIFSLEEFEDIAQMCNQYCTEIYDQYCYDGIHLLRRIYFDYFRIYYLTGLLSPSRLVAYLNKTKKLGQLLSLELSEFDAYHLKFGVGILMGKDLLFDLFVNNDHIAEEEYNILIKPYCEPLCSFTYSDMWDADKICSASIAILERAAELMDSIGDKTAIFVRYHSHELKMALVADGDYTECEAFCEKYANFAFRENVIEYKIYAELFQLKLDLNRLTSPSIVGLYGEDEYDYLKSTIQSRFRTLEGLINAQKPYKNVYAELNLKIYEVLFLYFTKQYIPIVAKEKFLKIKSLVQKMGYKRELNLIAFIEERDFSLSAISMHKLFMYYPIVPQ